MIYLLRFTALVNTPQEPRTGATLQPGGEGNRAASSSGNDLQGASLGCLKAGLAFGNSPAQRSARVSREQPRAGVWSQRPSRTPGSVHSGDFLGTALLGAWVCSSVW